MIATATAAGPSAADGRVTARQATQGGTAYVVTWNLRSEAVMAAWPADMLRAYKNAYSERARAVGRSLASIDAALRAADAYRGPRRVVYETPIIVEVEGDRLIATGRVQRPFPDRAVDEYAQYYLGPVLVVEHKASRGLGGRPLPLEPARVWESSTPAVSRRAPLQTALDLSPEELVLLTGRSPLGLHGIRWAPGKRTPSLLRGTAVQGDLAPFVCEIRLVPSRRSVAQEIRLTGAGWSAAFTAASYTSRGGLSLPRRVVARWRGHTEVRSRTWMLATVRRRMGPIACGVPRGLDTRDYRLLGADLNRGTIRRAERAESAELVSYPWPGVLPTKGDLRLLAKARPMPHSTGSSVPRWLWSLVIGLALTSALIRHLARSISRYHNR